MPSLRADHEALEAETAAASYLRGLAIASGALECVAFVLVQLGAGTVSVILFGNVETGVIRPHYAH